MSTAFDRRAVVPQWSPTLVALVLLLASVLLLYRETATAMVTIWSRSDTFAHAFTVPPIVAWLIWRQRDALAVRRPRASAWVLLPIGVAALIWLLGDLSTTNAVTQLAFTALLVLAVVTVLGLHAARAIAFPLAFLFFAVPVGEFVMPQMMEWTADFTVFALRLSGIPVFREGQQFVIPSGSWSVVEACSGVRYLIASVMVGVLFAYLNYRSLHRRLIFIGVAILVPIVANWVRAYLIVLTGHLSGNTLAVGADHLIYGWVFFGVVITLMFMVGARWNEPPASPKPARATLAPAFDATPDRRLWAVAAAATVLLIVPHVALWALVKSENTGQPRLAASAVLADGWQASESRPANWEPAFQGAAVAFNQGYSNRANRGQDVGLYVGYYRHQDQTHKLVSSDNAMVKSSDTSWSQVSVGARRLQIDGAALTVRAAQLRASGHAGATTETTNRLVAWQFYWVNGTLTANDQWAKACAAFYRLLGRGDDAAVIIVYAIDDGGGSASTEAALESFLRANLHGLSQRLADVRDGS